MFAREGEDDHSSCTFSTLDFVNKDVPAFLYTDGNIIYAFSCNGFFIRPNLTSYSIEEARFIRDELPMIGTKKGECS